ncbi:MAG: hypothetical protein RLZ55_1450 [Actinomycetota bacterium]|jgi:hypothetical protein
MTADGYFSRPFDTILTCDMRTGADGKAEVGRPGVGEPRWLDPEGAIDRAVHGWAICHADVEIAVRIAAATVGAGVMDGLSGDLPQQRRQLAQILDAAASAARLLARDHNGNSAVTDERWESHMAVIRGWAGTL